MSKVERSARMFAWTAVLLGCLAGPTLAQSSAVDYLGVPGPLELADTEYRLGWSAKPAQTYVKQEYLPKGEAPGTYTRMLLLEFVAGKLTPLQAARAQMESLEQRKKSDPLVNVDLVKNDSTGEVLLDFIVSNKDQKGSIIVEWNAYRYSPHKDGLVLFASSHRAYGNADARAFLQNLKTFRPAQIQALARAPLPKVVPKK
jgi:hypothetical protein